MAITTERIPYRILFQFGANGKIAGADIGYNVVVKDGDTVLNTIPEPVQMIGIAGWEGVDVEEVSSIINTALAEQNADLSGAVSELESGKEALQSEITNLNQSNTLLAAEVQRLTDLTAFLQNSLDAANAEIKALKGENENTTDEPTE